jgi:hypothetical protein
LAEKPEGYKPELEMVSALTKRSGDKIKKNEFE